MCLCPGISVPKGTNSGIASLNGVTGEQRKYTRNNTQVLETRVLDFLQTRHVT